RPDRGSVTLRPRQCGCGISGPRMSGFPLKVSDPVHFSLRRAHLGFEDGLVVRTTELVGCIERVYEHGHVAIPMNAIPTRFSEQQRRSHPAEPVIAALPALHLLTDVVDDGEPTLDAVRAGERLANFGR